MGAPDIDVTEELRRARRNRDGAEQERQLAAWYDAGIAQLAAGNLEQAKVNLERVYERQSGYQDVAERLGEIEKQLNLKQLFERASEYEAARNWEGAIEVFREILVIDRNNSRAIRRLARVQKYAERGEPPGVIVAAQDWWDERDRHAKAVWMALFGVIVVALFVGGVVAVGNSPATPTPTRRPTYPPAVLSSVEVIGCNTILEWSWSGKLAEDEWFAVRVSRAGIESPHSVAWTKERAYIHTLSEPGEYSWEIAICRGDPAAHICEELIISERDVFLFGGCSPPILATSTPTQP